MTMIGATPHYCHARGCTTQVPPKLFMCRTHWYTLPKDYRDRIWQTYKPGQEITKTPSTRYIDAATDAINYVADLEARQPTLDLFNTLPHDNEEPEQ